MIPRAARWPYSINAGLVRRRRRRPAVNLLRAIATIPWMIATYGASGAEVPDSIAAKGETVVLQVHAEGARIYECKAAQSGGDPSWQFREPVAALFGQGKTVGLHYAGPKWEIGDSLITAKVS